MAQNSRKHKIPAGTDLTISRSTIFEAFGNSIRDVVPVANATERSQLVSALTSAGEGPSSARPLVVLRGDARGLHRVEWTTDGSVWIPSTGRLTFASKADADSWGTSNGSYLTVGDVCQAGSGTNARRFRWSGSAWIPEQPAVRVYRANVHSSGSPFQTNGGTFRLNWDSESEDPWDFHNLGTNPERLTVPAGMGGVYTYWAKTQVEDNGADECLFFLDKNGFKVAYTEMALQGGFYKRGMISGEIELAAGDWVAYAVNKLGAAANLTPAQSAFGLRWERAS